jgi:hypothetical protein
MPRLRLKRPKANPHPAEAICTAEFRAGLVGHLIERGAIRPIDHPHVTNYREFWKGIVPLPEEENGGK